MLFWYYLKFQILTVSESTFGFTNSASNKDYCDAQARGLHPTSPWITTVPTGNIEHGVLVKVPILGYTEKELSHLKQAHCTAIAFVNYGIGTVIHR